MKRYLLLMPVILATTAAIADTRAFAASRRADAQAQAAALLSSTPTSVTLKEDGYRRSASASAPVAMDAQASAAALLSRPHTGGTSTTYVTVNQPRARTSPDAQAQAAALLSVSRTSTDSQLRGRRTQNGAAFGR
jgi:hypothetical protein